MIEIIKKIKDADTYVLVIENTSDKETILNDIPKVFPSVECLRGFVSAYGFGLIKVLTLDEYVEKSNNVYTTKDGFFITNVSIKDFVEDDN